MASLPLVFMPQKNETLCSWPHRAGGAGVGGPCRVGGKGRGPAPVRGGQHHLSGRRAAHARPTQRLNKRIAAPSSGRRRSRRPLTGYCAGTAVRAGPVRGDGQHYLSGRRAAHARPTQRLNEHKAHQTNDTPVAEISPRAPAPSAQTCAWGSKRGRG